MRTSKLKRIVIFSLFICILITVSIFVWWIKQPDPVTFNFNQENWQFPSTAGEAVKKHDLDFLPPGYYYKEDATGVKVVLHYHSRLGDFDDDRQAKEVLYGRSLHSYEFTFPYKPSLYDSLKNDLEITFHKKFLLIKGFKYGSAKDDKRPYAYQFLTISPDLVVGIKQDHENVSSRIITVKFMYDLSLSERKAWF